MKSFMSENDLIFLKTVFPDECNWKKLEYLYNYLNSHDDDQKTSELGKRRLLYWIKNTSSSDEELERTKKSIEYCNTQNGEKLMEFSSRSDIVLHTCISEKKLSINEFGMNTLFSVSLPGFKTHCGMKYTGNNLQRLQG